MNHSRLKYQQLFTALLLLFVYLVGNFSLPLFEGVHFLLHLGDDTPVHSFQSHNTQHQHQILASANDLVNDSSSTDFPTKNTTEKKLKKTVKYLEDTHMFSSFHTSIHTANYITQPVNYGTPYLSINSPPPKV